MTLDEILDEIDEKYPNSATTASKVRKINKLQRNLYRTAVKNTVATRYELIADQAQYPITYHPSKIREVLVDERKYSYKQLEADATSYFYYILKVDAGYVVGLYPTITTEEEMVIYHYEEPAALSTSNLDATPDLDSDFHDLLIYGVCKELAENNREYDAANGLLQQYSGVLDDFLEANQDTEPSEIQADDRW